MKRPGKGKGKGKERKEKERAQKVVAVSVHMEKRTLEALNKEKAPKERSLPLPETNKRASSREKAQGMPPWLQMEASSPWHPLRELHLALSALSAESERGHPVAEFWLGLGPPSAAKPAVPLHDLVVPGVLVVTPPPKKNVLA